jgi:hypothetical protein
MDSSAHQPAQARAAHDKRRSNVTRQRVLDAKEAGDMNVKVLRL